MDDEFEFVAEPDMEEVLQWAIVSIRKQLEDPIGLNLSWYARNYKELRHICRRLEAIRKELASE